MQTIREKILCSQCGNIIETRGDLVMAIHQRYFFWPFSYALKPYHSPCYDLAKQTLGPQLISLTHSRFRHSWLPLIGLIGLWYLAFAGWQSDEVFLIVLIATTPLILLQGYTRFQSWYRYEKRVP